MDRGELLLNPHRYSNQSPSRYPIARTTIVAAPCTHPCTPSLGARQQVRGGMHADPPRCIPLHHPHCIPTSPHRCIPTDPHRCIPLNPPNWSTLWTTCEVHLVVEVHLVTLSHSLTSTGYSRRGSAEDRDSRGGSLDTRIRPRVSRGTNPSQSLR